ncbi:MAG: SRPBCC family protein [Pseudobdellovibrionaceae bacterium]
MFVKILVGLAVIIGAVLIYAAVQPKDYLISREITVAASPDVVFPWINNSKKMNEWMSWSEMDPKMVLTYQGPEEGVDSISSWTSDGQMGVGKATIVESIPNQLVKSKLEYTKPFEGTQIADMTITPAANGSLVKWSVTGENQFIGRLMCIFMDMDKMVGGSFEKGLARLKSKVETVQ